MSRAVVRLVTTKDMQTTPSPLPIRNVHLDIKDAQCAETKDVLKISYHIILRFGAMDVQKG